MTKCDRSIPVIGSALSFCFLLLGTLVHAHHSTAVQFDTSRKITLEGVIVGLQWRNPHAWLQVEVEDESGQTEIWQVEFGSANSFYQRGWRTEDVPVGARVVVHGVPARDGSNQLASEDVILPDGSSLFEGNRR